MADIYREVDEEVRKEQTAAFLRRYRTPIIGLVIAVLAVVFGFHGWRYYDAQRKAAASDNYAMAMRDLAAGGEEAALSKLAVLGSPDDGGYAVLAGFQRANLLLERGDVEGAIVLWDEIAASDKAGAPLQGIASLFSIMHQIEQGDPATLRSRLAPLTGGGQAYRASALELQAVLALREGGRAEARDLYQQLADDLEVPAGLRARAAQMVAALKD